MRAAILERGPVVRRWVLLAVVAGVPMIFLRQVQDPINVPKLALLFVGVAIAGAIRLAELSQGARFADVRVLAVPAVAIAVPLVGSWLFSPYRVWTLLGEYGRFQGLIPYVVAVLFGLLLFDAFRKRVDELAWGFLAGGAFVAAYGLIQVIGADPFGWSQGGAIGSLGNTNFSGGFLATVLPVAIAMSFTAGPHKKKARNIAILVFAGLVATVTQGGWAAGIVGSAIVLGYAVSARWNRARPLAWVVAALVTVGSTGLVAFTIVDPANETIPSLVRRSATARGYSWQEAARMAAASPLVGRGPNSFAVEGIKYRTVADAVEYNFVYFDDPHSVPLSFLANAGLLGGAGFLVAAGWAVRRGLRLDSRNILAAGFLGSILAYFVQSLVSIDEVSLRVALWTALPGLAIASQAVRNNALETKRAKRSARAPSNKKKRSASAVRQPLRWPALVGLLAVAMLLPLWWVGAFVMADSKVREGGRLFREGHVEEGRAAFHSALGIRDDNQYRRLYGSWLVQLSASDDREQHPDLLSDIRSNFAYVERFPDARGIVDYARSLDAWGSTDPSLQEESVELYRRAVALDEFNPLLRVELSDVLVKRERPAEAVDVLEPVAQYLDGRYPQFWGALAIAKAQLGDRVAARAAVEQALSLNPEDTRALAAQKLLRDAKAS